MNARKFKVSTVNTNSIENTDFSKNYYTVPYKNNIQDLMRQNEYQKSALKKEFILLMSTERHIRLPVYNTLNSQ